MNSTELPGILSKHPAAEQGIFVPLFAVIALSILFIITVVGVDTTKVKLAQVELRSKLEIACQGIASNPINHGTANAQLANYWNYALQNGHIKLSRVTELQLIIPTMPSDGLFYFPGGPNDSPLIGRLTSCVNSISGPQGAIPCLFSGSVVQGGGETKKYPGALWDDIRNAGNAVGCEAAATVNTYLSGEKPINVKTVWWRPIRGYIPPVDSSVSAGVANSPGLTIAIGTQLTTDASLPRFRFLGTNNGNALYDDGTNTFRLTHDPLSRIQLAAGSASNSPFGFESLPSTFRAYPSSGAETNRLLLPSVPLSRTQGLLAGSRQNRVPGDPLTAHSDAAGEVFSDLEELSVSCSNPVVLVRNVFLSVIVEMASRHGQLRNMTEILHLNSKHSGDTFSSPPTRIGSLGVDISKNNYQLPYLFHYHSDAPNNPNVGAWINPFKSINGVQLSDQQYLPHNSLVSSQLRMCYHLYRNASGNGLVRYDYDDLLGFLDNSGFEPTGGGTSGYQVRPYLPLRTSTNYIAGQDWEQECPWSGGGSCTRSDSRLLNAAELVSALGTTQDCPYGASHPDPLNGGAQKVCRKDPANPLRPDIVALIRHLARPQSPPCGGDPGDNPVDCAITSPGLHPLKTDAPPAAAQQHYPLANGSYEPPQSQITPLLLVLHQSPDNAEQAELQDLIMNQNAMRFFESTENRTISRPVTIAFFPTTWAEHLRHTALLDAFGAKMDLEDSSFPNVLLLFSPFAEEWGATWTGGAGSCGGGSFARCEDEIFAAYWHFLLTDPQKGIAQAAKTVFLERLLTTEIKF